MDTQVVVDDTSMGDTSRSISTITSQLGRLGNEVGNLKNRVISSQKSVGIGRKIAQVSGMATAFSSMVNSSNTGVGGGMPTESGVAFRSGGAIMGGFTGFQLGTQLATAYPTMAASVGGRMGLSVGSMGIGAAGGYLAGSVLDELKTKFDAPETQFGKSLANMVAGTTAMGMSMVFSDVPAIANKANEGLAKLGKQFPKAFEKLGGNFISKMLAGIGAAAGTGIGAVLGNVVGATVGATVGYAAGEILGNVVGGTADKISDFVTGEKKLQSKPINYIRDVVGEGGLLGSLFGSGSNRYWDYGFGGRWGYENRGGIMSDYFGMGSSVSFKDDYGERNWQNILVTNDGKYLDTSNMKSSEVADKIETGEVTHMGEFYKKEEKRTYAKILNAWYRNRYRE